jgi:hypothetical protein
LRGEEPLRGEVVVRPAGDRASGRNDPAQSAGGIDSPDLADFLPSLDDLDASARRALLEAGKEVLECRRVLVKGGLNVVGEVLRGQGDFVEMEHYPREDVFDADTHAQYYYHAHRGPVEHGHFHTFLRAAGMPAGVAPLAWPTASEAWPAGEDAISHLVAISMDDWGDPIGLFATNRWVTGEAWHEADAVIRMLDRFGIDHAWPSWPTNRWLGAMLRLYRPWIEALIRHRDAVVAARLRETSAIDVFEDRSLEITGYLPISVDGLVDAMKRTV